MNPRWGRPLPSGGFRVLFDGNRLTGGSIREASGRWSARRSMRLDERPTEHDTELEAARAVCEHFGVESPALP